MPDSISGWTRTPPALKWLLNERAAVAGQLKDASTRCRALAIKVTKLQAQLEMCDSKYQEVLASEAAHHATLDALDAAIGLAYEDVRPDAAGTVNSWSGKYGKRGALTEFVGTTLKQAPQSGVDVSTLVNLAAKHFYISFFVPRDRMLFRKSVKTAIVKFARKGQAVMVYKPAKTGVPCIWRWKQPLTLTDLAAKAEAMRETSVAAEPNPGEERAGTGDPLPSRPEMAA